MTMKAIGDNVEADDHRHFWVIKDIFDFDNVGVSRLVKIDGKDAQYLLCADCEIGPIGLFFVENKKEIYLCVSDRVKYA
jgi:hypothetical protein